MSFRKTFETAVRKRLKPFAEPEILTSDDIQHLPDPVKKYLAYVGAIGKPKIINVRAVLNGEMKRSLK